MLELECKKRQLPPAWALWERYLIAEMDRAAPLFQARYTRADGSFVWRDRWPGFDGSDDAYESYHNWPLFYALGGAADLHERSRFLWEAVTRQFSEYGQIYREYDAAYDWMHHGESSLFMYYFGLADPKRPRDRARALRFAGFYMGEDPGASNWDAERCMIRSPINGSRGSRREFLWDDWETHRPVLNHYPAPFEDIPGIVDGKADWTDDAVYREILSLMNRRMILGDVPLNLTATSLITNAYLYTGEDRYRTWVLDYVNAWADRTKNNDGFCPDNIGPSGQIGEHMQGKWWGGYYGWRWPHGLNTIIQPLLIGAMNAVLLTGDLSYLDLPRSQINRMLDLGHVEDGRLLIPHRHTDDGWTDCRPMPPEYPLQLWLLSQEERDRAVIDLLLESGSKWNRIEPGRGKGDDIHIGPWYRYLQGTLPDYPVKILQAQWNETAERLERMRNDTSDPESWDVHHWQNINPVHTEGLVQLTMGGPQVIYHGGLLHVRLRYFDAVRHRPGLPEDVSALVESLDSNGTTVSLVNTCLSANRRITLQAGAFGEHEFTAASDAGDEKDKPLIAEPTRRLTLQLPAAAHVRLKLRIKRYRFRPSYDQSF